MTTNDPTANHSQLSKNFEIELSERNSAPNILQNILKRRKTLGEIQS